MFPAGALWPLSILEDLIPEDKLQRGLSHKPKAIARYTPCTVSMCLFEPVGFVDIRMLAPRSTLVNLLLCVYDAEGSAA